MFPQLPTVVPEVLPWVTARQMREVDRLMTEDLGVSLARMMENAGRSLAIVARTMLGGGVAGRRIAVLAGRGGNGGGGLVAARHLANAGADVRVHLAAGRPVFSGVPAEQLAIVDAMGITVGSPGAPVGAVDLVVDALLGYGQQGAPRDGAADLVRAAAGARVLALDIPTGVHPDSGALHQTAMQAEVTMTLAAPKGGLRNPSARSAVGCLLLADISVSRGLWQRVGARAPAGLFDRGPVLRVCGGGAHHSARPAAPRTFPC